MRKLIRSTPAMEAFWGCGIVPALVIFSLITFYACAGPKTLTELPPAGRQTTPGKKFGLGFYQQGIASWYGHPFHGCPTAAGDTYDMYALTAAHKELPLGSKVLVTNLENSRQIEVLINDRGPFIKNRIIDLSLAGARQLKMEKNGTAMVRLDIVELPESISDSIDSPFAIQFGAFKNHAQALALEKELRHSNNNVFIEKTLSGKASIYRVRLGWFTSRDAAHREACRLGHKGAHIFRR